MGAGFDGETSASAGGGAKPVCRRRQPGIRAACRRRVAPRFGVACRPPRGPRRAWLSTAGPKTNRDRPGDESTPRSSRSRRLSTSPPPSPRRRSRDDHHRPASSPRPGEEADHLIGRCPRNPLVQRTACFEARSARTSAWRGCEFPTGGPAGGGWLPTAMLRRPAGGRASKDARSSPHCTANAPLSVIPAEAGIQPRRVSWTPASAGVTSAGSPRHRDTNPRDDHPRPASSPGGGEDSEARPLAADAELGEGL